MQQWSKKPKVTTKKLSRKMPGQTVFLKVL